MRAQFASIFLLVIAVGCGAFGSSGSPTTEEDEPKDASVSNEAAAVVPDSGTNVIGDASANADATPVDGGIPTCDSTEELNDGFESRGSAVQGPWTLLTPSAIGITMNLASSGNPSMALSVALAAGNAQDFRTTYLEKTLGDKPCRELSFDLKVQGYPANESVTVASFELANTGGAFLIQIAKSSFIQVSEQKDADYHTGGGSAAVNEVWHRVIVRLAGNVLFTEIAGLKASVPRRYTSQNVRSIRLGAVVAKGSSTAYLIDNVSIH